MSFFPKKNGNGYLKNSNIMVFTNLYISDNFDLSYLMLAIIVGIITFILYQHKYIHKAEDFKNRCIEPSSDNPFMNPSYFNDSYAPPCETDNKLLNDMEKNQKKLSEELTHLFGEVDLIFEARAVHAVRHSEIHIFLPYNFEENVQIENYKNSFCLSFWNLNLRI